MSSDNKEFARLWDERILSPHDWIPVPDAGRKYLCIGGEFNGQYLGRSVAKSKGYLDYNCATHYPRNKLARRRAAREKRIIPPSMVWIHVSLLDTPSHL